MAKIQPNDRFGIKAEKVCELRNRYPHLEGGHFLQIECIHNYEMIRDLASYFGDLIVLSPQSLQDAVFEEIHTMHEKYLKIRT